jgi:phosphatidylethanolamine/phosphatidyl-N-methylethanolamine N-methyltransferase
MAGYANLVYDKIADQYDLIFKLLLGKGQKMAINAMDIKPGMNILEIGIGTGLTLPLYPEGIRLVGIDLSQAMLDKATDRIKESGLKNIELRHMSAEDLKLPDNSFDRVFAPSVLSVVDHPEKVLNEMVRTCKSGGLICVIAHFAANQFHTKILDRVFEPVTKKLFGFRMTTKHSFMENHPDATVVLKRDVRALNFSKLYMLQKK